MLKYIHIKVKTKSMKTTNTPANTHSFYEYLKLQPLEPSDGEVSELDKYLEDDTISLDDTFDESEFEASFDKLVDSFKNDPDKLTFSEE
jgi:hypothetical protein